MYKKSIDFYLKLLDNLSKIERLLSFVLTYCDADCIQEVIYQRLNIEKVRTRLELDGIDLGLGDEDDEDEDEDDEVKFQLDNLYKYYLNCDKSIDDDELFIKKDRTIRVLLGNLILMRAQETNNENNFIRLVNELAKSDASVLFAYLLELDVSKFTCLENLDRFEFDSFLSYEFLLYLFGLNVVNRGSSQQRIDLFKPSTLNDYILGK